MTSYRWMGGTKEIKIIKIEWMEGTKETKRIDIR